MSGHNARNRLARYIEDKQLRAPKVTQYQISWTIAGRVNRDVMVSIARMEELCIIALSS